MLANQMSGSTAILVQDVETFTTRPTNAAGSIMVLLVHTSTQQQLTLPVATATLLGFT